MVTGAEPWPEQVVPLLTTFSHQNYKISGQRPETWHQEPFQPTTGGSTLHYRITITAYLLNAFFAGSKK